MHSQTLHAIVCRHQNLSKVTFLRDAIKRDLLWSHHFLDRFQDTALESFLLFQVCVQRSATFGRGVYRATDPRLSRAVGAAQGYE